jgi:hypothetical protein
MSGISISGASFISVKPAQYLGDSLLRCFGGLGCDGSEREVNQPREIFDILISSDD